MISFSNFLCGLECLSVHVCARSESCQLKGLLICQVLSFFLYRIRIKRSNKVFKEANGRRKKYNSPYLCFFFQLNLCSSSLRGAHDFSKRKLNLSKTYWFLYLFQHFYIWFCSCWRKNRSPIVDSFGNWRIAGIREINVRILERLVKNIIEIFSCLQRNYGKVYSRMAWKSRITQSKKAFFLHF